MRETETKRERQRETGRETDRETDRDRERQRRRKTETETERLIFFNNTVLLTIKAGVQLVQVVQHIARLRGSGFRVESTPAAVARVAGWSVTLVWSVAGTWRVAVGRWVAAAMSVGAVPHSVVA